MKTTEIIKLLLEELTTEEKTEIALHLDYKSTVDGKLIAEVKNLWQSVGRIYAVKHYYHNKPQSSKLNLMESKEYVYAICSQLRSKDSK